VDAGVDAAVDAGSDSGADSGRDGGVDGGSDAASDAGTDADIDATIPTETITVTTAGWGSVASTNISGIACPGSCSAFYPQGTHVTLTATPTTNQAFSGWSGGACSGTNPTCDLVLSSSVTVHAEFTETYPTTATPVDESYQCTFSFFGSAQSATFDVKLQGATPTNVPPGTVFDMALFQGVTTVPASLSTEAATLGCNSVTGAITALQISGNDAHGTTTVNATAATPADYDFGPITVVSGQAITLTLPSSPKTIGSWTALPSGTMSFKPASGASSLTANLTFSCGAPFGSIPVSVACTIASPANIATTTVP
jgi:hypothetical protein